MAAFLAYRSRGDESAADFLARHADLRDLLEPLLAEDEVAPPGTEEGRVLGDYVLRRELGRGGMGVVFDAEQRSTGRRVAVKLLPPHLGLIDTIAARFRREAALVARLEHPGLARVLAVAAEGDAHYFAMEFVAGAPLDRVLQRLWEKAPADLTGADLLTAIEAEAFDDGDTPAVAAPPASWQPSNWVEAVLGLVVQVADALEHAHAAGILHRDVKPSNILVRRDGTTVLTDFGLARAEGLPAVTATGDFTGTPFYVSPEQAMAKRVPVDHRADVFSLGVVLYELLTLRRPFGGETSGEVLSAILTKEPRDPAKLNPSLAADLGTIVLEALEKDPDHRYQSAAALAADLRAFLAYRPIGARRSSPLARLRRFASREPLKAALIGLLVVGVPLTTALGGYVVATRGDVAAGQQKIAERRIDDVLADTLTRLGAEEIAPALQTLDAALREFPGHAELATAMAVLVYRRDGPRAGLACLDQKVPGSTDPLVRRARSVLLRRAGETEAADRLDAELGPGTRSFELLLQALLGPSAPNPTNEAVAQQLELAKRMVTLAPTARPLFHMTLASAARAAGDDDAGRCAAEGLQRLWPSSAGAWYWAGLALEKADPEQALASYARSADLEPRQWRAHYRSGNVLRARHRLPEAIAAYRRALDFLPTHSFSYCMLGFCLIDLGELDQLRPHVTAWRAVRDPACLNVLGNFLLDGRLPDDLRSQAAQAAGAAVELAPRTPQYRATLARALQAAGQHGEAAQAARDTLAAIDALSPAERAASASLLAENRAEMERLLGTAPPRESAGSGEHGGAPASTRH